MKKVLAVILALLCMTATICGCGDKKETSSSSASNSSKTSSEVSSQTDDKKADDVTFKEFEDLPKTMELICIDDKDEDRKTAFINTIDTKNGSDLTSFSVKYGDGCYIDAATSNVSMPGAKTDDYFFTNYYYYFVKMWFNDTFPQITDNVTLACGVEALKFECDCPDEENYKDTIHRSGYGFVFNDMPIIVFYSASNNKVDDAKKAELQGYIDEMIQTVRTQP